jgi:hypothetical protein
VRAKAGVTFRFSGDHHWHYADVDDDVMIEWDQDSQGCKISFGFSSLAAAESLYWRLLEIIPELRKDRR